MQGRQEQPEEERAITVTLGALAPTTHFLRRVDKVLDLSFIYELTVDLYCAGNGRPSIDPVLFFRMQLISYLYGIRSERRLCEEIHLNLAYRWFCQLNLDEDVPEHSSLTRIRDRFGLTTYQMIFDRILEQLKVRGLLKGRRVMVDASLIEADASIESLQERPQGDPDARALKLYEQRYHDFKEGKKTRQVSNQTHVSLSDPGATLVSRPGTFGKLYYKGHYIVDAGSRVIIDCHATTGARHECTVFPERLAALLLQRHLPIEEVLADKGYGRGPTYRFLRERKIRAYIPLHIEHLGEGKLSRREFIYERRQDRSRCPQNHYLYPYEKLDKRLIKRYRILGGHCRRCPIKNSCLPKAHKQRARFVYRSPHQDDIDRVKKRQQIVPFKRKLRERQWKIEGLFSEAEAQHCLRRAKYRGLTKMQIQLYLTAIAQNTKRLVAVHLRIFSPDLWQQLGNVDRYIHSCLLASPPLSSVTIKRVFQQPVLSFTYEVLRPHSSREPGAGLWRSIPPSSPAPGSVHIIPPPMLLAPLQAISE